jgi:hypothetical protein
MQRVEDTFQQAFCRAKYGKGTPFLYLLFSSFTTKTGRGKNGCE